MWGDPHIGGPDDWRDDWADFDTQLEMTFAFDGDGKSINNPDIIPGYMGYKFLESPGVSNDGIDNDEDGMIDESWTDGLDNDDDWNPNTDDVGVDGVANTGDAGEKDGIPTAGDPFDLKKPGEPNFEFTDIDESDMIGLTSFAQPLFGGLDISNDWLMWRDHIQPGNFDTTETQGDYVFLYGSGKFTLSSLELVSQEDINLMLGGSLEIDGEADTKEERPEETSDDFSQVSQEDIDAMLSGGVPEEPAPADNGWRRSMPQPINRGPNWDHIRWRIRRQL